MKDATHLPDSSLAHGRTRLDGIILALHGRCREGGGGRFAQTGRADHRDEWCLWLTVGRSVVNDRRDVCLSERMTRRPLARWVWLMVIAVGVDKRLGVRGREVAERSGAERGGPTVGSNPTALRLIFRPHSALFAAAPIYYPHF